MPVCHILQTEIYPSRVYDDTLDNTQAMTAATLEEDLNYIRTVLKMIGGGANWYTPDITQSLGQLEDDFQVEHYTTSEDPALAGQHKNIHADSIRSKSWVSAFEYFGLLTDTTDGWIFYYDRASAPPTYVRIHPMSAGTTEWENYFEVSRDGTGIKTRIVNEPIDNEYDLEIFKPFDGGTVHATKIRFHQGSTYWSLIKADNTGISIRTGDDTAYHRFNAGDGHFYNGLYANDFVQSNSFRLVGALAAHPTGYDGIFYRFGTDAYLQVQDNLFIRDETAGEKFHFVTDTGSLGINKVNPTCELDVNGNACFSGNVTVGGALSFPYLENVLIPPEFNQVGTEYNLLVGAEIWHTVTVSGSAATNIATELQTNIRRLFDSSGLTFTSTDGIDPADPLIIEIDLSKDVHTQTKKAAFGWTSRYWYPTDFTVEYYDYNAATWVTVATETAWNHPWYSVDLSGRYVGGLRLTIRQTADTANNRLQLAELFFVHPEAGYARSTGYAHIGYELHFPASNALDNNERAIALGRNPVDKTGYLWAYASDYNLKFGSRGTQAAIVTAVIWDFSRRIRIRGEQTYGGKIYLTDTQDRYVIGIASTPAGRLYVAPFDDGAWQWNREFGYNPDINRWYFETAVNAVAFYETSSRERKKNIREFLKNALDIVNRARVVTYQFKDKENDKDYIGLIAEEAPDEFTDAAKKHVDVGSVVGVLIKAIQELTEKVKMLEARLEAVNAGN